MGSPHLEPGWKAGRHLVQRGIVRQKSVGAFMAFAVAEAYLAGIGHRTAALIDSLVEAPR